MIPWMARNNWSIEIVHNWYSRTPPTRLIIRHSREDYQSRWSHAHTVGNGRPKISEDKRVRIKQLLDDYPRLLSYDISFEKNWNVFLISYIWEQNLLKVTRLRRRNLLNIGAVSLETIADTLKGFFSQTSPSFAFRKSKGAKLSNLRFWTIE